MAALEQAIAATDHPTAIVLTRQGLPTLPKAAAKVRSGVKRGGYVVTEAQHEAEGILMASGSEVKLAVDAQQRLAEIGHDVRVVSIPSFEKFSAQSADYQARVLPKHLRRRVAVEMASGASWYRYVGLDGVALTQERFGASGNGPAVVKMAGFTPENIVQAYLDLL